MNLSDWTALSRRRVGVLASGKGSAHRSQRSGSRPTVEGLESRRLLTTPTLTVTGASLKVHFQKTFTAVVGTLTSSEPDANIHDFHVKINWGDGKSSTGKLKANKHDKGSFSITGTHKYATAISNQQPEISVTETNVTDARVAKGIDAQAAKRTDVRSTRQSDVRVSKTTGAQLARHGDVRLAKITRAQAEKSIAKSSADLAGQAFAQVEVAGAPLTFAWQTSQYTAGQPITGVIATLTATSTKVKSVNASINITYPDGTSETVAFITSSSDPNQWQASASGKYTPPASSASGPEPSLEGQVSGSLSEQQGNSSRSADQKVLLSASETEPLHIARAFELTAYSPANQSSYSAAAGASLAVHFYFLDDSLFPSEGNYFGSIDWGDNGPAGQLSTSNFQIVGTADGATEVEMTAYHTYSSQGSYSITTSISSASIPFSVLTLSANAAIGGITVQILGLTSEPAGRDITVGLIPPPDTTPPLTAVPGEPMPWPAGTYDPYAIELPLATFAAAPTTQPGDYTGTINWGDGTTSAAIIRYEYLNVAPYPSPYFNTMAVYYPSKSYSASGVYSVTVTIVGPGGVTGTSGVFNESIN